MKLLYSFLKDMTLSLRGYYFYIEIIFAAIFVAVLVFVVPENFEPKVTVFAYFDVGDPITSLIGDGFGNAQVDLTIMDSRDEVVAALEKNRGSVGLSVTREDGKFIYDYIIQGYEHEKFRNIIRQSVESQFASNLRTYEKVTEIVTLEGRSEKLSDRVNILPVFLALNAAFMGLFIIASYIFLDKDEGTIRAFAVTPARVWHYLAGKVGVMLVAGLISTLIATIAIAGKNVHYLHLIVLLIATNSFGSALGLFIASFFDTMTKAMGWLYLMVILLSFASISYYVPAFSPLYIRILPSYPMLFAFRETLMQSADIGYIYANVGGFAALAIVLFGLANIRFKKTLTV